MAQITPQFYSCFTPVFPSFYTFLYFTFVLGGPFQKYGYIDGWMDREIGR
jgi:hypothetical protein